MAEQLSVLINQMVIFASLIIIGLLAQKVKLLKDSDVDSMANLVIKILLPAMIVTLIPSGGTRADILGMLPVFICSYIAVAICLTMGWLSSIILRLKQPTKNIHIGVTSFGNGGFIGYPLILAVFPEHAPLMVALYAIVDASTVWTIGAFLASTGNSKFDIKKLVTPTTLAVMVGLAILILDLRPSGIVWDTVSAVGGTSKYIALIYIGADIGRKGIKRIFNRPVVFSAVPIKLIISPLLVYFILGATGLMTNVQLVMLTTLSMTPTMVAITMLARTSGSDDDYASGGVIATTIFSVITMPFVMWIITM